MLFSDYAEKFRFVKLPPGTSAKYSETETFDFPVGTVIAKTFAYPVDARDPSQGRRLIETRILKHEPQGWVGLPYIWNAAQTEATLDVAGDTVDVAWIDTHGDKQTNNYIIPNSNQCKGCHKLGDDLLPIGPKVRHLNRDFTYKDGSENQLVHWKQAGALVDCPDPKTRRASRSGTIQRPARSTIARGRGWKSTAHIATIRAVRHAPAAWTCAAQSNPTEWGVFKTPVAAGRGSADDDSISCRGIPKNRS